MTKWATAKFPEINCDYIISALSAVLMQLICSVTSCTVGHIEANISLAVPWITQYTCLAIGAVLSNLCSTNVQSACPQTTRSHRQLQHALLVMSLASAHISYSSFSTGHLQQIHTHTHTQTYLWTIHICHYAKHLTSITNWFMFSLLRSTHTNILTVILGQL